MKPKRRASTTPVLARRLGLYSFLALIVAATYLTVFPPFLAARLKEYVLVARIAKSTPSDQAQLVGQPKLVTSLSDLDFANLLQRSEFQFAGHLSPADLEQSQLSADEQRMLSRIRLPDGISVQALSFSRPVLAFYERYRRLPESGLELLSDQLTFQNNRLVSRGQVANKLPELPSELADVDSETAFRCCYYAVNPVTGSLYSSFDNPNWTCLGLNIEALKPFAGGVVFRYPNIENQRRAKSPAVFRVFRVVVYGQEPGEVIYEGLIESEILLSAL